MERSVAAVAPIDLATAHGGPVEGVERDEELTVRVAAGDAAALATLYDRHAGVVIALLLRIVRDRVVAEDLLQETFLSLWRHATAYEEERGHLRGWLLSIAHHLALNELRRARRRPLSVNPWSARETEPGSIRGRMAVLTEPGPEPPQVVWEALRCAEVVDALGCLPPAQRTVIELYALGYSQSEIAAQTAEPLGTVKSRMRRGLLRLRELLQARGLDADAGDFG